MAKKTNLGILYLVGMALVVLGFCLPMFSGMGINANGFKFINFKNGGFVSIGALFIIIGGIAGFVSCFVKMKNASFIKMIALLVSIIGGIILVIGFSQNKIYAFIGKGFIKHAAVGFYLVLAGWIAGIIGYLSNK
ncbi:MAG: hypothetical protein ACI4LX_02925 [Treponema sp.]